MFLEDLPAVLFPSGVFRLPEEGAGTRLQYSCLERCNGGGGSGERLNTQGIGVYIELIYFAVQQKQRRRGKIKSDLN